MNVQAAFFHANSFKVPKILADHFLGELGTLAQESVRPVETY